MAYTTTSFMPLKMPTPGSREPAQISLINENMVVVSGHDHANGKGVPVATVRSGLAANRPAPSAAGGIYFATDTGIVSLDNGSTWTDFLTSGGSATVTGWTLIDPIIRDTLLFGPEPTGTADTSITRSGANALQFSGNVGVGVAPAAWGANWNAIGVGAASYYAATKSGDMTQFRQNSYDDGTTSRAIVAGGAALTSYLNDGSFQVMTAPSVAAGAAQTFTPRLTVAQNGRATINADNAPLTLDASTASGDLVMLSLTRASTAQWHAGVDGAGAFMLLNGAQTKRPVQVAPTGTVSLTPDANAWGQIIQGSTTSGQSYGLWIRAGTTGDFPLQVAKADNSRNLLQLSGTGTLTLTPEAGQPGVVSKGPIRYDTPSGNYMWMETVWSGAFNGIPPVLHSNHHLVFHSDQGYCMPMLDNNQYLGSAGQRWNTVYAASGTINTSSADMKQDIAPLDPAACAAAVLETDWVSFSYLPPAPPEYVAPSDIAYDEHDSNEVKAEKKVARDEAEAAQKAAYAKMLVETQPARDQRGYVLGSADHQTADLFGLSDRKSASPSSDLAVVACALQDALRRLAALEANNATA